ncbi:unnamed protein product [Schistosoma margrebowiei]|uniref:Uncharacterized protein n=1 Tax=Schistosoma margrebowiei TaxID=48269 RepID=A0A183LCB9_9TREM|nr:unnamed protein product [Schistosoma margrebowiei]
MLFPKTEDGNFVENTSSNLSLPSDWQNQLEILITVGDDLFLRLDDSSRYKPHLHKYLSEARRVIMHLYLESFSSTGDCTPCFTKLNQYFPASDPVGSNEWVYNDVILLRFNTLLALIIRQQLFGKSICTEKDIFEIMHTYNSQSCPSQLI